MYHILLAEDDPIQRHTVRRMLENDLAAEVTESPDGGDALQRLQRHSPAFDLVLIDLDMPVMDGFSLLRHARKLLPQLPCIVLTASESVESAVDAMQLGAVDFITKPAQRERLITSARNAFALRALKEEVKRLQQAHALYYSFDDIIAINPYLRELAALGKKAASSEIPVLITGESGVGKEVFARAIHLESRRSDKPFVPLNCGAIPDNLVESTLFGHEKGSFTGAIARTLGKCREADGGVLFLDEVGELKPATQVKLLRMLQQGEIEPLGGARPLKVDVRVISATNQPLEKLVAQNLFREDLFYRLQGLPMHIPPLRERRSDIPMLAEHLLRRLADKEGRPSLTLSKTARDWLTQYPWPGNVRELQYVLMRAVLLTEGDSIEAGDLQRMAQSKATAGSSPLPSGGGTTIQLEGANGQLKTLEQIEQEVIEATLARFESHIGKAAAALGVGQSTLYKRLRKNSA